MKRKTGESKPAPKVRVPAKPRELKPEEAVQFLEDMRTLHGDRDEPAIPISIRIPGNLLRLLKSQAQAGGKRYQSLMIEFVRLGLKSGGYK